jgi:Glycosyl hydrolase family 30 beta sandwich domain
MLTSAAFKDPEGKVVLVLLNEATESTEIILKDSIRGEMKLGINARSMQTIVY